MSSRAKRGICITDEMKKEFRTKNLLSEAALNPQFVEVHDCVLFAGTPSELRPKEVPASREDRQRAEYWANRRDVWELFEVAPPDPSPKLLTQAGNTIAEIWESKLKAEFPDRKFLVYFEYALPICEVSFFQALPWHIEAEAQAKANWKSHRADWRPKLVKSPLIEK